MTKIFISYRRDDTGFGADRVFDDALDYVDDRSDVFMDIDGIPPGADFVDFISDKVAQCDVLFALIGRDWLDMRDPKSGERRLDDPDDFVRIEIASALARGIPVVPLLMGEAPMPRAEDLPDDLKPLARRNARRVGRASFRNDMAELMAGLGISNKAKKKGPSAGGWAIAAVAVIGAVVGGIALSQSQFWDAGEIYRSDPANPLSEIVSGEVIDPARLAALAAERGDPVEQRTFRDCADCPEMVVIPSGSFVMGSPSSEAGRDDDEGPQRTVRIGYEFAVGKTEVTWAEWEACVADGGCSNSGPNGAGGDKGWGKGSRPVINVSWEDAQAYVQWLSRKTGEQYRLLSEAEWEYVARAGTTSAYWWGGSASHEYANYGKDQCCGGLASGRDRWVNTSPAGSFPDNPFGLHDLHGNVWEWTQDCYVDSYSGAPTDGSARLVSDCSRRVLRGGSWGYTPQYLRSADRVRNGPSVRNGFIGFRVARTL